jgi:hypothetical protein
LGNVLVYNFFLFLSELVPSLEFQLHLFSILHFLVALFLFDDLQVGLACFVEYAPVEVNLELLSAMVDASEVDVCVDVVELVSAKVLLLVLLANVELFDAFLINTHYCVFVGDRFDYWLYQHLSLTRRSCSLRNGSDWDKVAPEVQDADVLLESLILVSQWRGCVISGKNDGAFNC